MSMTSTVRMFCCTICSELLGENSLSTQCGHLFHFSCIQEWFDSSGTTTCPNCRNRIRDVTRLYPSDNDRFQFKTNEEMESLHLKLTSVGLANISLQSEVNTEKSEKEIVKDSLKQMTAAYNECYAELSNHLNSCKNANQNSETDKSAEYKFNEELSKRILLQKEVYEYHSRTSATIKILKSENAQLKSLCNDNMKRSKSSKNTRSKNAIPCKIKSPKINPSSKDFLSNCHFWIVDELRKVSGATHHLYFNEDRVKEYGGTVAYYYSNMVTHVIGNSQQNPDVLRGIKDCKKCVTDSWLSDVIAEKKIKKPWLAHHFPIPYSEDKLPYANKQVAIVNFNSSDYFKIKTMVDATGATVINKISRRTCIVISLKLEGEKIRWALALNIPVVNVQWINDILLGEVTDIQHHNHEKYKQFNLIKPCMNFDKVSHLMEAWNERPNVRNIILPNSKINKPTTSNKKKRTM